MVDRTQEAGTANRLGWWTSVAHADFDNDGDLDYVVGNMGLNSKYHVSAENPYLAYWGDADGSGQSRFVEACKENGHVYPVRGKAAHSGNPSLAKKFKTFHAFASAGLSKFTNLRFSSARKLEINELASGLLVNSGKGTFRSENYPAWPKPHPSLEWTLPISTWTAGTTWLRIKTFFPCNPKPAA